MKKLYLVLLLVTGAALSGMAQRTLTGKVVDEKGEPLIGATILVEGTTTGTVTDVDGNYSIRVPEGGQQLTISYTGYAKQTIEIGASNVMDITMQPDAIGLENVIVIGYSPQRKKDITGSVASVSSDDIAGEAGIGIQTALRGRAPGVTVVQNSGTPGGGIDVRVRGSTSISASNRPLYVVDGVPVIDENFAQEGVGNQGINSLADLNPADIESIEVLKDASTAAIYGSRGANGVVLITTKKGKAGQTNVDFNASYGVQEVLKTIDVVDAEGYRSYLEEIYGDPDFLAGGLGGNSNWQEEIFRQSAIQDYNLAISGGSEKTRFYTSLTLNDNEGIIEGSRFRRYSGRLNLDHFVSDKFTIGMNMGYTNSVNNRLQNDNNIYGALSTSILLPPTVPIRNEDGSYGSAFGLENPVAATTEYDNTVTTNRIIGNVFGRYEIVSGLSFRASLGVDNLSLREDVYQPSVLQSSVSGIGVVGTVNNLRWINEYTLTYQKNFSTSSLTAVVGAGFQEDNIDRTYSQVNDFPTDNFTALDAGASPQAVSGNFEGDNLRSYFANVNYSYNDLLILTGTFRTDGSSRFINNQYGYFPGLAVAWRISQMGFMTGSGFDDLKLRVSWGQTGNNNIGNFTARQLFGGGFNYQDQPGITPTQLGNPDLRWETTTQSNIGIDFAFANQRISGSIDAYIKATDDLLFNRPIPTTSGFTTVVENVGEVENRGLELSLTTRNFVRDFKWETTFNVAYNKNEVKALYNDQPFDVGFASRVAVGQPIGAFFGYVTDGIFQNQGEVDAHATQPNAKPGDFRFKDLNSDGVINDSDRDFIGSALPDFTGGLNSMMSYKGFTLDAFFQFAYGNEIFNNNNAFAEGLNGVFAPTVRAYEGAWRQEGDGDDFPRIIAGDPANNRRDSDRFTEDGSYLRLKTATLAYNIPSSVISNIGLRKLRVYVAGTNLLTFTKYSWYDPEVNTFDGSNTALGTDFLTFPQARSIIFGINAGF